VRKVIAKGVNVARRFLIVMEKLIQLDESSLKEWEDGGGDPRMKYNPTHQAAPLITPAVKKTISQQIVHLRNGCIDVRDDIYVTHLAKGMVSYRNIPSIRLMEWRSFSGSSKCESVHSALERVYHDKFGISPATFDARALWMVTHYNRAKIRDLDPKANVIPDGFSAVDRPGDIISLEESKSIGKPLLFGTEYLDFVQRECAIRNAEISTANDGDGAVRNAKDGDGAPKHTNNEEAVVPDDFWSDESTVLSGLRNADDELPEDIDTENFHDEGRTASEEESI
jgi:hypothetical protein